MLRYLYREIKRERDIVGVGGLDKREREREILKDRGIERKIGV